MQYFTWHLAGGLTASTSQQHSYVTVGDLRPLLINLYAKTAPGSNAPLTLDINDDGVSIFTFLPNMWTRGPVRFRGVFVDARILEGSVLTLDIDQVGSPESGRDLTVQLVCEEF
jgi:hypothetical protein